MTLTWSRRHTLIAGLALIALTNAVALGGVAWNRSGEPDSVLKLTQRELGQPYGFRVDKESGGLVLDLRWRVLAEGRGKKYYADRYGTPVWLDRAKLGSLGFPVSQAPRARDEDTYDRLLPREALVVLELDGPARAAALESAHERAREEMARAAAEKDKKKRDVAERNAAESLQREETLNSRLFVVDVGLDAAALRAKYPDRTRYAIVHGSVRAQYHADRGAAGEWTGHIEDIDNGQINVPLEFRKAIGFVPQTREWEPPQAGSPFQATVAFGKRFEPWVTAVTGMK